MDKLADLWDAAASYASTGWAWVNRFTSGPLLALILLVVLLALSQCAAAQQSYPALIDINAPDIEAMRTPTPNVLLFCEGKAGADGVHLCQPFRFLGPNMVAPAGSAVYCFVVSKKEVIHEGVPRTAQAWSCGLDRPKVAEEAARVKGEVNLWKRPLKPGEQAI